MKTVSKAAVAAVALLSLAACSSLGEGGKPAPAAPVKAVMEMDPGLPTHTVYRPVDLSPYGGKVLLPIVAWANGGCRNLGNSAEPFLTRLAEAGYLVVAIGPIGELPPRPAAPAPGAQPEVRSPAGPDGVWRPATDTSHLRAAVDWAIAEGGRKGGRFFGKLDATKVAVMGTSCGGLQALSMAVDPRVTTAVIFNSGVLNDGPAPLGVPVSKAMLDKLIGPMLYVTGGKGDVAYPNAHDDFGRITKVPVAIADIEVGHSGTYRQPGGGAYAPVVLAWLDWRLKGDKTAAKTFTGRDCGLCRDAAWTLATRNMD